MQYADILRQGRKNLVQLREAPDAASTLNLKDKKIEAERVAIEEQMEEKYQADALVEEQKRALVEERQQRMRAEAEEKALLRKMPATTRSDGSQLSNSALAAAGMAAVVGSAVVFNSAESGTSKESESPRSLEQEGAVFASATLSSPPTPTIVKAAKEAICDEVTVKSPTIATKIEASSTEATAANIARPKPIDVQASQTTSGRLDAPQVDKEELAAKAMEEYLEKDDGGDDWLQSLNQILEEEEDANDV